jgi:hypothetical protein
VDQLIKANKKVEKRLKAKNTTDQVSEETTELDTDQQDEPLPTTHNTIEKPTLIVSSECISSLDCYRLYWRFYCNIIASCSCILL